MVPIPLAAAFTKDTSSVSSWVWMLCGHGEAHRRLLGTQLSMLARLCSGEGTWLLMCHQCHLKADVVLRLVELLSSYKQLWFIFIH